METALGEVIYTYTREQALADGTLIDVSTVASEAGFCCSVALTAAAWGDCVAWAEADSQWQGYQDEIGRLWDVLLMASRAAKGLVGERLQFELYRVPRGGRCHSPRPTRLTMIIGPGDQGEAVITLMQPDED